MSLKDKCKQRSRPPKDKGNHRSRRSAGHQAAAPEGGREKRRDRRDLWLCVYISGSMQAIGRMSDESTVVSVCVMDGVY